MHFLCTTHRKKLCQQAPQELEQNWFTWMNKAALYYGVADWSECIAHSGCAFDLSLIQLAKHKDNNALNLTTLAAIYLSNAYKKKQMQDHSQYFLTIAVKALEYHYEKQKDETCQCAKQCITVLRDEKQHHDYFIEHLNMPFEHSIMQQATMQAIH